MIGSKSDVLRVLMCLQTGNIDIFLFLVLAKNQQGKGLSLLLGACAFVKSSQLSLKMVWLLLGPVTN